MDASQSQRTSRVLAALDDPSFFETESLNGKRKLSDTSITEESTSKRRAASGAELLARLSQSIIPGTSSSQTNRQSPRKNATPLLPGVPFNLNYDNETPVQSIDVGGPDRDVKMAEFITKAVDNSNHGRTVSNSMKKLNLSSKRDLLPGLEVRLLPHQIIGVSWMIDQENSSYKGGILADDMGLGKTVQMIATMVINPPKVDDERYSSSLIVVPAALLQQWKEEIEVKTNDMFTVHVHHGRDKLRSLNALQSKDVIITTYQTLNSDFILPNDLEDGEELDWLAENGGVLARNKWYRVILDEAQFIRNRSTRSSKSVALLRSRYRWMLTGTPVTNTLADLYGLIRFGKFRPWNNWQDYNEYVAKVQQSDAPLAGMRAQEIIKPILLRRTKNSTIEGEPILQLPPKDIELVKLDFSEEERDIYNCFEKRASIRVGKFIRAGTLIKNNAAVLAMILRLRQLCCHPHLILSKADGFEDPSLLVGSESDKECGRAVKVMGSAWVVQVKKRFLSRAIAMETIDFSYEGDEPDATCPSCHDLFMNDTGRVLTCQHEICFDCLLELSNSPPVHDGIFGYGTEQENLKAEKEYEAAVAKGFRACPTCKKMVDLTQAKVFKSTAFDPSDEQLRDGIRAKRQSKKKFKPKDDFPMDLSDTDSDPPSPTTTSEDIIELDSSDDELPDLDDLFANDFALPVKKEKKAKGARKQGKWKGKTNSRGDVVDLTLDEIDLDDSDVEESKPKPKTKLRNLPASGPQKDKAKARPTATYSDGNPSDAVLAHWRNGDIDLEPSAKMLALVGYLKEWEAIGDKSICFSQWTSMLNLVEKLFTRYGIRSLRYDGQMDRGEREAALSQFKRVDGPKVILISTRCGGVGLNLVTANRIVNLDLSWNYAAESQAYDRVHRLGQEKDVFIKRLVVRNTIEERMLQLQDVKVGLADAALGEGTGAKLHKMSIKEIKLLFGMSKKNDQPQNGGE